MQPFGFQIGERHQDGQAGHAVEQQFPETGIAVDYHQVAERRQTYVQHADLSPGQADAESQGAKAEPGQEFFPR